MRTDWFDFMNNPFVFGYQSRSDQANFEIAHSHNGVELLLVHEGEGMVNIQGQDIIIERGSLLIFQPYQRHHIRMSIMPNRPYIRSMLLFEPGFIEPYLAMFPTMQRFFIHLCQSSLASQVITTESTIVQLEDAFRQFSGEVNKGAEPNAMLLITLFNILCRQPELKPSDKFRSNTAGSTHVRQMISFLDQHFKEQITLERIGEELHLSSFHVSHLFKKVTGSTIIAYLTERRVREACFLLTNSPDSIKQVAYRSGFGSETSFIRTFKEKIGCTPQQYRKRSAF